MNHRSWPLLLVVALVASCMAPLSGRTGATGGVSASQAVSPLRGTVRWQEGRTTQATTTEIATAATVSLIDPATGNTLATTLTDSSGRFILSFGDAFSAGVGPYFLEAVKGLSIGGNPNRPGAPAARLRTLVSRSNGSWRSFTGNNVIIGRSSTALSILANLRNLPSPDLLALMDTVRSGSTSTSTENILSSDSFTPTTAIPALDYFRAYTLVDQAIAQDLDPVAAIVARPDSATSSLAVATSSILASQPNLALARDGILLTSTNLDFVSATIPTTVILRGNGLPASASEIQITLNGTNCPILNIQPDSKSLTFQVPAGLTAGNSYPLVVQIGPWTHQSLFLTVQ